MVKLKFFPYFDVSKDKCTPYMLIKITRSAFTSIQRSFNILELIYCDICDLHSVQTLGGKRYFVTFIDDYSKYYHIYLLHTKNEILKRFKVYKSKVELQCESIIKCL
uniref:Retrovirus-related Pol polyprotein from transposon TNT 1-94 n=1 Tax=Rhizophora mucronata TaxID=61149 RepID=A0A2P2NFM4_RHIMU